MWRWRAWQRLGERERRWQGPGGGGQVRVMGGTGSPLGPVGGGAGGHWTAVAGLAAPGGAGAVVAGGGVGGPVRAQGGTGSPVGLLQGAEGGHGAAVARVVAPGGARVAGAGPRVVVVAPWGAGVARVGG